MNGIILFGLINLDLKYLEEIEEDMFGEILRKDLIQNA
jgi:hypothetical protein